jgi:long-chain fatty acid transport protein
MKWRCKLSSALLVLACMAMPAFAQSFNWSASSPSSIALGGIYVPSSSNAQDALAANPAGLSALGARTLDLTLTTVAPRGSFSNSVNNNAHLDGTPGVLPYGAFGMPVRHSRVTWAVGFLPDLMSVADWHYVDAPGVAGASYGLQEQHSAIIAGRAVTGLGIAVAPRLSLGVSLGVDYNTNTLIAPYIFQSQPTLAGLKTLLTLRTSGYGWNGSVGALVRASRKVELGVAWKSSTVIMSHGGASGDAYAQFNALGLSGVPSSFEYQAQVRNVLPQSVIASMSWHPSSNWMLAFQTDWVNWGNAFVNLPVTLTNGTNAAINGLVGSSTLVDGVPLNWKDQYLLHVGAERAVSERASLRFGYAYGNNPVPSSTLTPMTAAIMSNQISTGLVYNLGHSRLEAAYVFDPTAREHVQQSGLLSGEYDNSTVRVGTQALTLGYSVHF